MKASEFPDAFQEARQKAGVQRVEDHGEPVSMVLRLADLRSCAKDWETFSSGKAEIGRIVVPSEADIRDIRQIPVETDPPEHTDYRALLEPWFKRPLEPAYRDKLTQMTEVLVNEVLMMESVDAIGDLALKLQSRALTLLLQVPYEEAETWIGWGTHVFRSEEESLDEDKAAFLDEYISQQIDQAIASPGEDLYTVLLQAQVNGRSLSRKEVHGIINLAFAGGRDTVINVTVNSLAYLAEHPEQLQRLHEEPRIAALAVEELVRYFSPLTHLGRVTTEATTVCGHQVADNSRISLCWASANRDEAVFTDPDQVMLDRRSNPHVGFGFGHHKCLGATHARQLLRIFLLTLAERVKTIDILDYEEQLEQWGDSTRKVGFKRLNIKFHPR